MKRPVVDIAVCTLCMGCVEMCPAVFYETDAGYIAVADLKSFPEQAVDEAIKYCPVDAIEWEAD